MNEGDTKRRSKRAAARSLTDWARLRNMRENEIETGAVSDQDNPPWSEEDFERARVVRASSARKPMIWVHVDDDVREWVQRRSGDTDQMINDLLRSVMEQEEAQRNA